MKHRSAVALLCSVSSCHGPPAGRPGAPKTETVVGAPTISQFFAPRNQDWIYYCLNGRAWVAGESSGAVGVLPVWVASAGGRYAFSGWGDSRSLINAASGREVRRLAPGPLGPTAASFDRAEERAIVAGVGYVEEVDLRNGSARRIFEFSAGATAVLSHDGLGNPVVSARPKTVISDGPVDPCDVGPSVDATVSVTADFGPIWVRRANAWERVLGFERKGTASLTLERGRYSVSSEGSTVVEGAPAGCAPRLLGTLQDGSSVVVTCGDSVRIWPTGTELFWKSTLSPWVAVPGATKGTRWHALGNNTLLDLVASRIVRVGDKVRVVGADVWWLVQWLDGGSVEYELFDPTSGSRRAVGRHTSGWAGAWTGPRRFTFGHFAVVGSWLVDLEHGSVSDLPGPAVGVSRSFLFTARGHQVPQTGPEDALADEELLGPIVRLRLPQ